MMNKKLFILLSVLMMAFMSSCYWQADVGTNQVGAALYKNKIQEVKGPGVYSAATCWFCELRTMDIDTQTFSVDDPEVLTKDNQAVGVKITIQARRKSDADSVQNIMTKWGALVNNESMQATITATAREGMKNGTRQYTLPELLDDRNGLAEAIRGQLEEDAKKYSVEIVNVTVENIAPDPSYMAILGETANIKAQTDKAIRQQDLINQQAKNDILAQEQRVNVAESQVLAEQAETNVQVEIARRQGEVTAAQNEVYSLNVQAYELERLRLLKEIFGDKTMFLPSDTVMTLIQGTGGIIPLPAQPAPEVGQ